MIGAFTQHIINKAAKLFGIYHPLIFQKKNLN